MNIHFTLEQKVVHHLIIHALSNNEIGLLTGRMGSALSFYLIGRMRNNEIYTNFGNKLLDSVIENIDKSISYDFSSGLCGIGWGIEFLIHERLVEGNSLVICEELDKYIMRTSPRRLDYSLEFGLEGLLYYVLAHLYNSLETKNSLPFDSVFLEELYDCIQKATIKNMSFTLKQMCDEYICFYHHNTIKYGYSITNIIGNNYSIINDGNFKNNPLSLFNGLSGYLIWSLNHVV